jgi:hypothetical protein
MAKKNRVTIEVINHIKDNVKTTWYKMPVVKMKRAGIMPENAPVEIKTRGRYCYVPQPLQQFVDSTLQQGGFEVKVVQWKDRKPSKRLTSYASYHTQKAEEV